MSRWFGRARNATFKRKAVDFAIGVLYTGGWPAAITQALGWQGKFEVAEHGFPIRRSRTNAPALRAVFASDFHSGPTLHPKLLAQVFDAIAAARGDLLLLGGDFVSFHARYVDRLVEPLRRIAAPLGKFAVLGNHDLLGDDQYITQRLTDAGITVLVNGNARLPAPHDDVWVCGLDDWDDGEPDATKAFRGANGTRLLLAHQPDALGMLQGERFDAAFFGHVHGGQFMARKRRPVIHHRGVISRLYLRGGVFHSSTGAPILVSRGIGTSTLPARRHADPEIHICRLEPAP
jgi:uncharacterized protein